MTDVCEYKAICYVTVPGTAAYSSLIYDEITRNTADTSGTQTQNSFEY